MAMPGEDNILPDSSDNEKAGDGQYMKAPALDINNGLTAEKKESLAKKGILFGMGCVGCGLLGCGGLVLLSIFFLFIGIYWIKGNIFSEKPLDIPKIHLTDEEEKSLIEKMKPLREALDSKIEKEISLKLTCNEFNYQMQNTGEKSARIYLEPIADRNEEAQVLISIPVDSRSPQLYLNLTARGKFKVEGYNFETKFAKVKIGKIDITDPKYLEAFSKSFAREINNSSELNKLPFRLKNFKLEDGNIYIDIMVKSSDSITSASKIKEQKTESESPGSEMK